MKNINITDMIISNEKRIFLHPYTPTPSEWSELKMIADHLGLGISISPERGYRAAPAMKIDGMVGSIQKHITGWKTKEILSFENGKSTVAKGVTCTLKNGMFITPDNRGFEVPREHTKQYLKPQFSFFLVIDNRKIDLNECSRLIEQEPQMKDLIVKAFFNKEFYTK